MKRAPRARCPTAGTARPRFTSTLLVCALAGAATVAGTGCRPTLDDRPWLITSPQIVGWTAEPPEAAPRATVQLQAVILREAELGPDAAPMWTLCRTPRPLDEPRVATTACLPTPAATVTDAVGNPIALAVPADACRLFGPDTPQPALGMPPSRPHDPDATGGYFQPVAVTDGAAAAIGLERITCALPDASLEVTRAFLDTYRANQNPILGALAFSVDGAPIDPAAVPPAAHVVVEATWAEGANEAFPIFDRGAGALVNAQETLLGRWYVTAGELDQPAVEIGDPNRQAVAVVWTAPAEPASVELAFVLRDSRGGSAVARAVATVAATVAAAPGSGR